MTKFKGFHNSKPDVIGDDECPNKALVGVAEVGPCARPVTRAVATFRGTDSLEQAYQDASMELVPLFQPDSLENVAASLGEGILQQLGARAGGDDADAQTNTGLIDALFEGQIVFNAQQCIKDFYVANPEAKPEVLAGFKHAVCILAEAGLFGRIFEGKSLAPFRKLVFHRMMQT